MILEGQCGQFNPLLLECLKEISPQLSRTFKKEKDDNREYYEAQRISEEILRQNALPRKDHSQRVIEIMQEKIKFFKENSGKISMEYNAISGKLVLTDGESQKEYQRDNLEFDLYGAYDRRRCRRFSAPFRQREAPNRKSALRQRQYDGI